MLIRTSVVLQIWTRDLSSVLGFTNRQWDNYRRRKEILIQLEMDTQIKELPVKEFKPSYPNLPRLKDYKGNFPEQYWSHWVRRSYEDLRPFKSWICPMKLKTVARQIGYSGKEEQLVRVLDRLENGCDIGCRGSGRLPTRHPNSKSTEEYGVRVADALQGWIIDGLCFGPLEEEELPWKDISVNPITVKIKPNGKARICIDMSAPHTAKEDSGLAPSSVNSGINSDDFPTVMSSTKSFCESLMRSGCPGQFCKIDWNQARHVH